MSVLLFGASHHTAPVSVLEKLVVDGVDRPKLLDRIVASGRVSEVMVLSTCNRVEVYAVVDAFHPGLEAVSSVLSEHSGIDVHDMVQHCQVLYAEAAVRHLFSVASGLDSMVLGEDQILGQVRTAYMESVENSSAGTVLHDLAQRALRVGKRVRADTDVGRSGASVVSVAVERVMEHVSTSPLRAAVVGTGSMGSLMAAHLACSGVSELVLVNRTVDTASRVADSLGGADAPLTVRVADMVDLVSVVADVDVAFFCTGSSRVVLSQSDVTAALALRASRGIDAGIVLCDLGVPHDLDPAVAGLVGVNVVDMQQLVDAGVQACVHTTAAWDLVSAELSAYLVAEREADVIPTVTALRQRAGEVIAAELLRLDARVPGLVGAEREEVAQAISRVVDKLLHTPIVRVKQLANSGKDDRYAQVLQELFELTPGVAEAVSSAGMSVVTEGDDLSGDYA